MERKRRRSVQVVLTREEKASISMSIELREIGFKPIIFPTVQFVRVYSDYTGAHNFSGTGWLVFSTRRSVEYFFKRFRQKIDPSVRICALGAQVGEALRALSYEPDIECENSTASAITRQFEKVDPGKVVFLGPKSNSGMLTEILNPKGFTVKDLPLYTTEIPAEIDETKLEIIKQGYYDVITFASGTAVRNLMMILNGNVSVFKGKTAIVIGAGTEKLLTGSAFGEVLRAESPNESGLIDALVRYRDQVK